MDSTERTARLLTLQSTLFPVKLITGTLNCITMSKHNLTTLKTHTACIACISFLVLHDYLHYHSNRITVVLNFSAVTLTERGCSLLTSYSFTYSRKAAFFISFWLLTFNVAASVIYWPLTVNKRHTRWRPPTSGTSGWPTFIHSQ